MQRPFSRLMIVAIPGLAALALAFLWWRFGSVTEIPLRTWLTTPPNPTARASLISTFRQPCPNAPFLLPSAGFVGFLYADPTAPYTPFNGHTGIDIFGDGKPGEVPVYAAYDGYLTRLPEWRSTVIIRHPQDPLNPSRQIWTYYTHMASQSGDVSYVSAAFPPGTSEKFVKRGELIGYQGMYAGSSPFRIGLHVHFSIVLSEPDGAFKNEGRIANTLDPSPYLGFNVNATRNPKIPVACGS